MVDRLRNQRNAYFRSLYDTVTKFLTWVFDNHNVIWFSIYIVDYAGRYISSINNSIGAFEHFSQDKLFEIRLKR